MIYHRNREAAVHVVETAMSGARAVAVQADVASERDVERVFAAVTETLGALAGLVNNAGVTLHIGDLADTPVATSGR